MLLLKLLLVPLLILLVTLAGRRWGAHIAGWLSAFPVVGGPILFFIAVDHGIQFATDSALGMFGAISANIIFSISYAWLCRRCAWYLAWPFALTIYALLISILTFLSMGILFSLLLNSVVIVLAPWVFPPKKTLSQTSCNGWLELPLRMFAGACLVLLVTGLSERLGAQLSGMMAMFPVMASVLAVFTHRNSGCDACVELLRGALLGWYAFSIFSFIMAVYLPEWGVAKTFVSALVAAVLVQLVTLLFMQFTAPALRDTYDS